MSTNLSPEAKVAREKYLNASSLDDKIDKLEKYISLIPKHKATENMVARLRSKLAKLKDELEDKKRRQKALSKGPTWVIPKEGDAQVPLVGIANAGKSQLLKTLTGANTKVGEYAFSTVKPEPGVLDCKGAIIQLIDLPSIYENIRIESEHGPMLLSQIRGADLIIFVIDLSKNVKEQMTILLKELSEGGIKVNKERPKVDVKKTGSGGALIFGDEKIDAKKEDIIEIMNDRGMYNFSLKILEKMTLMNLVEALDPSLIYCNGIIIATKGDLKGSKERYEILKREYGKNFDIYPISTKTNDGLESLPEEIFQHLDLIRIKSKEPNGGIAKKPIVVKEGSTVADVAKIIHSRFYKHFKQAKIFGPSAKFEGQSVGLSHELADGDIVEIFAE
ncbi:MAG: GTPase [Asgard group archaeon]|nr:GTPase [Asgard group archaeon]